MNDRKNAHELTGRLPYMDVMKGILIIMVVFGHIYYALEEYGGLTLDNVTYNITAFIANVLIAPYYMAAFFFVTGFCSSFKKPITIQIKDDFRQLVLPGFLISLIMGLFTTSSGKLVDFVIDMLIKAKVPWFVMSLFWAKLLFRLITDNMKATWQHVMVLIILSVLGCYCMGRFRLYNYLSAFQAFAFVLFVYLGYLAKDKSYTLNHAHLYGLIFVGLCSVLTLIKYPVPALCSHITFGLKSCPLFLLLATTGTLGVYYISRIIKENCILEYLGRNSLVIYLTHFAFLIIASHFIPLIIEDVNESKLTAAAIIIGMLTGSIFWSMLWIQVLNMRYLRWILGKATK